MPCANLSSVALAATLMLLVSAASAQQMLPLGTGCIDALQTHTQMFQVRQTPVTAILGAGDDLVEISDRAGDPRRFVIDGGEDEDTLDLTVTEDVFLALMRGKRLGELADYFRGPDAHEPCEILDLNPVIGVVLTDFERLELHVLSNGVAYGLTDKLEEIADAGGNYQNVVFLGEHLTTKRDLVFYLPADRDVVMRHRSPGDALIPVTITSDDAPDGSADTPARDHRAPPTRKRTNKH